MKNISTLVGLAGLTALFAVGCAPPKILVGHAYASSNKSIETLIVEIRPGRQRQRRHESLQRLHARLRSRRKQRDDGVQRHADPRERQPRLDLKRRTIVNKSVSILLGVIALSSSVGCTTVRTMTARQWIDPSGASSSAPVAKAAVASAAPAPAPAAEGAAPAPAAPPADAAPAAPPGGIVSHYYLTYWEGKCSSQFGCSRGNSHVKRCKVNADNSVACVEEPEATKALSTE